MRMILIVFLCSLMSLTSYADTIDHYINIANSIPKMEMKADAQSQSWARSARNVLLITAESIAETLNQENDERVKAQGQPLFCLPQGKKLDGQIMNELILKTYGEISSQQSDKDKMTVSQVAWLAVTKNFPCNGSVQLPNIGAPTQPKTQDAAQMQQMNSLLGVAG